MDAREALIALNMIEGIGPIRVRKLLEHFGEPQAVLGAPKVRLQQVSGIGAEVADRINGWENSIKLSEEFKRIEEWGCQVVTQLDEEYPPSLREIYDPPIVLYVKGDLSAKDKNGIAMVGSRQTTHYGIETARKLSYQLAYAGVTVVSGGARGIDTAAHQGALSAKGRTIAVLGTGINIVFPTENRNLFERISENGAVITQFPFNRSADKQSFPIRNRIVAGMTLGTVVVEANLTSGSLITTRFATDYGRQVFAVPGRIDSPRSKGCHDLIKKGAKLCEDVEDILDEFEYLFPASNRPETPGDTGELLGLDLTEEETRVLDAIGKEQLTVDEIIRQSGFTASKANVLLMRLQMKRLILQMPGRVYRLNK
jgi:DNA processing protein